MSRSDQFYATVAPRPLIWEELYHVGTAVIVGVRFAHVATLPPLEVPEGAVPIMYDDESRIVHCVKVELLQFRFPKQKQGSMFAERRVLPREDSAFFVRHVPQSDAA